MKRILSFSVFVLLIIYVLTGWNSLSAQNTGDNDRYNLAVYATGLQNDQPISSSLLTVVQNKTITKLTGEGNYRLIERSNEFLRQIQNEQVMQQSGEVADGQIAEIGAGYGAQKICVVSVTIIDKYLYIATRIVDVATKTSYESGDAEVTNYTSIPDLTKALEDALNRMVSKVGTKVPKTSANTPDFSESSFPSISNFIQYKQRLKDEGVFLSMNSMAYKKYHDYRTYLVTGTLLTALGGGLAVGGALAAIASPMYILYICPVGVGVMITGIVLLYLKNEQLKQSYQYYINGDRQTATLNFHPYIGGNHTFGAGLTLRF